MNNLRRILSSAKNSIKLQFIIEHYLRLAGFTQFAVNGMVFEAKRGEPPAFAIGAQILNYPIGLIYVSEGLMNHLPEEELEFVVLHEMAHILNNHLISNLLVLLGKGYLTDVLADILDVSYKEAQDVIGLIKLLWMLFTRQKTIEEEITAQMELEADKYAVSLQGKKEPAISFFLKASRENIKAPTHVTVTGRFVLPALSFEERINALRNL